MESSERESQRLAAVLAVEGQPPIPIARPSGFISQINSIIDNDPQINRRSLISKAKDTILQLESQREESRLILLNTNEKLLEELELFQKQKIVDIKNVLESFSLAQKEYHRKCLDAWKLAQESVNKI